MSKNGAPEDDAPGKDNDMQHAAPDGSGTDGVRCAKIKLASLMYKRNTDFAFSGMQGRGAKTTPMKHFYGAG